MCTVVTFAANQGNLSISTIAAVNTCKRARNHENFSDGRGWIYWFPFD